jgi:hypothetical protein
LEEDSLALWSKEKYVNTDAPEKFEILDVKIQMLGRNKFKLPESNLMWRALQKVAEKGNKIFDFSKGDVILNEIESGKDVPKFFAGLESKIKKRVLQMIVSAFEHYGNVGPEFIQDVERECGLDDSQIEALIQWINRDAFKVLETVENKIPECFACSSTIKRFRDSKQLIEFDAQYSNDWCCDECGKYSRDENLFPMHHCTGCEQDQCRFCIPSLECFPWYADTEGQNLKNEDADVGNYNVEKNSFDTETSNGATEANPETYENYCKNQKRKRDSSTELELEQEKPTEEEKQNRKL